VGEASDGNAVLANPQAQNSYSYAGNNPIVQKDPTGRIFETAADVVSVAMSANDFNNAINSGSNRGIAIAGAVLAYDTVAAAVPGLPSSLVGKALLKGGQNLVRGATNARNVQKAEEGIIYLRTDKSGSIDKAYVGQTKNSQRFVERQKEHARANPNSNFEFRIIDRGTSGKDLNSKEQQWLNQFGGPTNKSNPNGGTSNKKNVIRQ